MPNTISNHITQKNLKFFSKKTRDRILGSSLILFNERGFSNVTTASIAKHANVLEGSLWYHFNTKKDLLAEHVKILTEVFSIENKTVGSKNFKSIINGIFNSYEILWDFRYILRDDFENALQKNCDVLMSVKKTNNYLDEWADERIRHSSKIGLLNIDSKNTENISEIILIIGRYWMDFSKKKYPNESVSNLRFKGLNQIIMVLGPFLTPAAKSIVSDLLIKRDHFKTEQIK
jgi:AcrR family transcriptional regulator